LYRRIEIVAAVGLVITFLAACQGGASGDRGLPTIDETAVIEERLPTLQAQMTSYAGQLTSNAPTIQAIMTSVATAGPPTGQPAFTPSPAGTLTGGGAQGGQTSGGTGSVDNSGGVYGSIDFDDVNTTTVDEVISVGQTVTQSITDPLQAHNWQLQGTAGQTITLTINFTGTLDPRIRLFTSTGTQLSASSSFGGSISYVLSNAGFYIIRIDSWPSAEGIANGTYTLTVE
jgi:hypothetical protein